MSICRLMVTTIVYIFIGVYSAAFDNQLEWVVIKGISYYAVEEQTQTEEWLRFSSIMAASVVKHILSQPDVLKDWPRNEN